MCMSHSFLSKPHASLPPHSFQYHTPVYHSTPFNTTRMCMPTLLPFNSTDTGMFTLLTFDTTRMCTHIRVVLKERSVGMHMWNWNGCECIGILIPFITTRICVHVHTPYIHARTPFNSVCEHVNTCDLERCVSMYIHVPLKGLWTCVYTSSFQHNTYVHVDTSTSWHSPGWMLLNNRNTTGWWVSWEGILCWEDIVRLIIWSTSRWWF